MDYTDLEQQTLSFMQRTDFKNISRPEAVKLFSQLKNLRPEVATKIIEQFPEFASVVKSFMAEYKEILGGIIESDDKSIGQVYTIAEKELDTAAQSRTLFYDMAEKV